MLPSRYRMTTKVVPGQLIATRDAAAVARDAATRIARALRNAIVRHSRASLALSGGNTPRDAYSLLARESGIDWTKVNVFWVDERAVPASDDRSNYRWAKATLLDVAGVAPERVHRLPGDARDLAAAAREYEGIVREYVELDGDGVPAFDVVVLGIGDDGHTASLFPGESTVDIQDRLVAAVPRSGQAGGEAHADRAGAGTRAQHLRARRGCREAACAGAGMGFKGDIHETPGRVLRGCRGTVTWIIDRAAGGIGE